MVMNPRRSRNFSQRAIVLVAIAAFGTLGLFAGCYSTRPDNSDELIVSAAASLKDAFNEIAQMHQQRTGTKVRFNFGASGALQKQIESGAPADLFASAGAKQMDELAAKNLILPSSRRDFARNVLVLIEPANGTAISSFADLGKAEIRKIAVGNPKTVPAGQYTEQTLNQMKLLPAIQSKLIYAEDVRQVLDYVTRGEVDAGIVYSSDALVGGSNIKTIARAPGDSHDPILYPMAVVKDSQHAAAAQKFIDLVQSPEGQAVLVKYGFVSIK
jgi:molybdate transport system substrate-binding protein